MSDHGRRAETRDAPRAAAPARRRALLVLLGALLGVGLAVGLLLHGAHDTGAASVLRRTGEASGAPGFAADAPEGRAAAAIVGARSEPLPPAAEAEAEALRDFLPPGPRRSISGRVLRAADGTPLEGARVQVTHVSVVDDEHDLRRLVLRLDFGRGQRIESQGISISQHRVLTDADGRFELGDVTDDVAEISVASDNAWPARTTTYPLPAVPGDITGLELVFDSGFVLRGTVRDTRGAPVADALVGLEPMEPVATDASGGYEFRDVAPESGALFVHPWAEAAWHERARRSAAVPEQASQVVTADFTLHGSGGLAGTVTGPGRAPVTGAEVRLVAETSRGAGSIAAPHHRTVTGSDGRYSLDHVPAGTWVVMVGREPAQSGVFRIEGSQLIEATLVLSLHGDLVVSGDDVRPDAEVGLAARFVPDVLVETGRATQLDVVLDAGAVIEGRVLDSDGEPLPGAKLTLERRLTWSVAGPAQPMTRLDEAGTLTTTVSNDGLSAITTLSATEQTCTSGEDGGYRFARVCAGDKVLHVVDAEQDSAPAERSLAVFGTEHRTGVDFRLPVGFAVRGRVTDPSGVPVEGASVSVEPEGTVVFTEENAVSTDPDGAFEVRGLPAAPHALFISRDGSGTLLDTVMPGDAPRTWVLQPAPHLYGLVLDASTGQPVLQFALSVQGSRITVNTEVQDWEEGRFTWSMDDDAPCTVIASAPGYAPDTLTGVRPSTTSEMAPLTFRLSPLP